MFDTKLQNTDEEAFTYINQIVGSGDIGQAVITADDTRIRLASGPAPKTELTELRLEELPSRECGNTDGLDFYVRALITENAPDYKPPVYRVYTFRMYKGRWELQSVTTVENPTIGFSRTKTVWIKTEG